MKLQIRQETTKDHATVFQLVEKAFRDEGISDHDEHFLVERLRKSNAFVPELSLVAVLDDETVGHIILTKIKIINDKQTAESLALAPVSVLPDYHNQGIGSELIHHAHKLAKQQGFSSIMLLGHENYYPRFGYLRASQFGISFPFDAPDENCMAIELTENALQLVSGAIQYPKEFFES